MINPLGYRSCRVVSHLVVWAARAQLNIPEQTGTGTYLWYFLSQVVTPSAHIHVARGALRPVPTPHAVLHTSPLTPLPRPPVWSAPAGGNAVHVTDANTTHLNSCANAPPHDGRSQPIHVWAGQARQAAQPSLLVPPHT
jgi:hypothetical protein